MKVRYKLRTVSADRPLGPLSRAEKLAQAKAYLLRRGLYVLDRGTPKPKWGIPFDAPQESTLMKAVMESDRRRK